MWRLACTTSWDLSNCHTQHIGMFSLLNQSRTIFLCSWTSVTPAWKIFTFYGNKNTIIYCIIWSYWNRTMTVRKKRVQWQIVSHFCRSVGRMFSSFAVTFWNKKGMPPISSAKHWPCILHVWLSIRNYLKVYFAAHTSMQKTWFIILLILFVNTWLCFYLLSWNRLKYGRLHYHVALLSYSNTAA